MVFRPLPDNCDGDKSRMNVNVSQSSLQHAGEIKWYYSLKRARKQAEILEVWPQPELVHLGHCNKSAEKLEENNWIYEERLKYYLNNLRQKYKVLGEVIGFKYVKGCC